MASITCGKGHTHTGIEGTLTGVQAVKACHDGAEWFGACGDLVGQGYDECGDLQVIECGADIVFTDRGHRCANGHEYTNMETRYREGWDYADDPDEAGMLAAAGTTPVLVGTGLPLFIGHGA